MTAVAGGPVAALDVTGLAALTTGKPLVRLVASGTQSIPTNTLTPISFSGSEEIDTHNYHNPASFSSRITPLIAGYYRITGYFMPTTTQTNIEAYIGKNGTAVPGGPRLEAISTTAFARSIGATAIQQANGSSDYFELLGLQNSGGSLLTNQSSRFSCTLELEFLRS